MAPLDVCDAGGLVLVWGIRLVRGETEQLSAGLCGAVWDPSKEGDVRLDNFTSDIDILDAFEYAFEGFMKRIR